MYYKTLISLRSKGTLAKFIERLGIDITLLNLDISWRQAHQRQSHVT